MSGNACYAPLHSHRLHLALAKKKMVAKHTEISPPTDLDTPIYKYLSTEAFLYLMEFHILRFNSLRSWPDSFEGGMYEHLQRHSKYSKVLEKEVSSFVGSCWTLQQEDRRLYTNDFQFEAASKELEKDGSSAMWEAYCKSGGARIKTTIRKILDSIIKHNPELETTRGKAYYEPAATISRNPVSEPHALLFKKKVPFRFESEFRFIVSNADCSVLNIPVFNFYDFIDEILISPASESKIWISRSLFMNTFTRKVLHGKKRPKTRISQLYALISEEV